MGNKRKILISSLILVGYLVLLSTGMVFLYVALEHETYPVGLFGEQAATQIALGHLVNDPDGTLIIGPNRYRWIPAWDRVGNGFQAFFTSFSHGTTFNLQPVNDLLFPGLGSQLLFVTVPTIIGLIIGLLLFRFLSNWLTKHRIPVLIVTAVLSLVPALTMATLTTHWLFHFIIISLECVFFTVFLRLLRPGSYIKVLSPLPLLPLLHSFAIGLLGDVDFGLGCLCKQAITAGDNHLLVPCFGYFLLVVGLIGFFVLLTNVIKKQKKQHVTA